ncbi:MAG: acyltransferase [Hydrogenophaga sp.]|nr:acyltransferase [Hydrogenophaga sp.]
MNRSALIDGTKAVASQLIVLHHLSLYAPMTDWVAAAWPALVDFLSQHGRLAVQPFLVIGGFLTAQSLGRRSALAPVPQIGQRYLRLAPQLLVALVLVILATAVVGGELGHEEWLSPLPSVGVFLAHVFFLQDVLRVPALSAGVWYVAIDLQLYALFVVLAHATRGAQRPLADSAAPIVVAIATAASLLFFSRQPGLDVWAIYFLSAYGLGALAAWSKAGARARWCWWLTVAVLVIDAGLDPRPRPVLALVTALALCAGSHVTWRGARHLGRRWVEHLSDVSYSVFVCHFAVIVMVSGLWERFDLDGLRNAWMFVALAWGLSIGVGTGVQRFCDRWLSWRRAPA